jgi:hypothetical protein
MGDQDLSGELDAKLDKMLSENVEEIKEAYAVLEEHFKPNSPHIRAALIEVSAFFGPDDVEDFLEHYKRVKEALPATESDIEIAAGLRVTCLSYLKSTLDVLMYNMVTGESR